MISILLTACGGGGGTGAPDAASGASSTSTTSSQAVPTNPYTNQQAPGTSTTTVTGAVFNSAATVGTTVKAYIVNPDGSNGTLIGTATTGSGGTFNMTLARAPYATASYVRFVTTGGTYTSTADSTMQTNNSLELVTPYVTTAFNNFVITPVTYVASQRMVYLVSTGVSLANGYTLGASMVLSMIGGNDAILAQDTGTPGVDYLALVPGSSSDTLNAYADALNQIEAFGVEYDLPSSVAESVLSESQLTGSPSATMPNGSAIYVGQWQSGTFNTAAPYTLADIYAANAVLPSGEMFRFMTWEYAHADCASGNDTPYFIRWPLTSGEPNMFTSGGACTTYGSYVSKINALVSTNHRSAQLVASAGYVPQTVPVVGAGS
ncbi:hypothetical protein GNZ13_30245 [Paraburkholderia sp. 5N]|uniref:Uncharacterized protein n=2 Tax=Paraburkholderia elongata TaxID=2675747 RepID=A0A972SK59_9BURK|nr:hypothetical protein [Paraburkholderia elongata]